MVAKLIITVWILFKKCERLLVIKMKIRNYKNIIRWLKIYIWVPKNWRFWTVVLENTWESLGLQRDQPVHSKGDQPWVFLGRSDAKAESPVVWPPHAKSWLIGKDCDAGRDWGQEEKGIDKGWDGWMASRTQWVWVWVNSRSWWCTGRPGMLRFMGLQSWTRLSDWTELNWTDAYKKNKIEQWEIFVCLNPEIHLKIMS